MPDQQLSKKERSQLIEKIQDTKQKIIKECKLLATFKVSSAREINERTKELLSLESKLNGGQGK